MQTNRKISRRELLSRIFRREEHAPVTTKQEMANEEMAKVAIIQGRYCLAYQSSFCSVCSERCPEPGAIITERGIPRVIAEKCSGCKICHDVCPAPTNAILLKPRMPFAASHN